MAENTMDNDVDPSATGNGNNNDPASEIAALRERLMRALAEAENTRRQGERRAEDAQQYAIPNFARELLQVVDAGLADAPAVLRPNRRLSGNNRPYGGSMPM